ncbi:hypothetical protein PR003_g27789 [Phytophthora rubi]|uniref:Uncharacterized protein n=1 Tax=Phytophthora rubi TaxID=129364 RepID=A0A6A4C409_9STRA|nr:hypothetical protein PR003_g27789 [Phytophthora rubi]
MYGAVDFLSMDSCLSSTEIVSVERRIQIPLTLNFLVGLLSDCYHGAASQGYMILNCSINAVAFFAIAGASALLGEDSTASIGMVILVLVLVAMASIGCIITYVCVHTGVIEYSQLESLRDRGSIQASYLIFRRFVSIVTSVLSFLALGTESELNMSVSAAMVALGWLSVLPLPLVFRYWNEDVYSLNTSIKIRSQILWKVMQQRLQKHWYTYYVVSTSLQRLAGKLKIEQRGIECVPEDDRHDDDSPSNVSSM